MLFAERLRAAEEPTVAAPAGRDATRARARLGGTQAALLEALVAAGEVGLTTAEVAGKVGMAPTNAPRALKALVERGLLTASKDVPTIWRAVADE